jgi:carboxylate-amine ligase
MVGDNGAISVAEMIERVIEDTTEDADALDSLAEMRRCRTIVNAGTSADAQIAVYEAQCGREGHERALQAVTNWIAAATLE